MGMGRCGLLSLMNGTYNSCSKESIPIVRILGPMEMRGILLYMGGISVLAITCDEFFFEKVIMIQNFR